MNKAKIREALNLLSFVARRAGFWGSECEKKYCDALAVLDEDGLKVRVQDLEGRHRRPTLNKIQEALGNIRAEVSHSLSVNWIDKLVAKRINDYIDRALAALDDDGWHWIPILDLHGADGSSWEVGDVLEVCNMRAPDGGRAIVVAGITLPGRYTHWRHATPLPKPLPPPEE